MKKLFLIAVAMLLGLVASAADYVEVTGTNVRLRTQPSLQGAIYKDANNNPIYPKKGAVLLSSRGPNCISASSSLARLQARRLRLPLRAPRSKPRMWPLRRLRLPLRPR